MPTPGDIVCEFTAITITDAATDAGLEKSHLLVCGGGVHNVMKHGFRPVACAQQPSAVSIQTGWKEDPWHSPG
jgi:1,6-anhydro-N-acetylmuramate kinase